MENLARPNFAYILKFMKKIVLFDFDGVLVDSAELSYQINIKSQPELTKEAWKKLFEGNIYDAQEKLVKQGKDLGIDEDFFKEYTSKLFEVPPVKGIGKLLEELRAAYQLIVVSSTISSPIEGYLSKYGLARYFESILGGDVHKSKTVKINMVLGECKVKPEDCVFITDTLGDMREAARCGVWSIGVIWGFHGRERLEKGNFFAIVDKIEELSPTVQSFFSKKDLPRPVG